MKRTMKIWVMSKKQNTFRIEVPATKEVCFRCRGEGKHVNPSIDGHGLTREDFDQDPDFEESYFRGDYDIECLECKGLRVVDVPDLSRLSPKMLERVERFEAYSYREQLAERSERRWQF